MVTNQKCLICNQKATILTDKQYCSSCFMRVIEKRFKKQIRDVKSIESGSTIQIKKENTKEYELSIHLLKKLFNDRIKIVNGTQFAAKNMDEVNDLRMQGFLNNNKISPKTYLLENITEDEIIEYCKIIKIPIKRQKHNQLINDVEQKYPGSKFALAKSLNTIKKLEK